MSFYFKSFFESLELSFFLLWNFFVQASLPFTVLNNVLEQVGYLGFSRVLMSFDHNIISQLSLFCFRALIAFDYYVICFPS